MRAAVYVRLSEETDDTTSPQRQRAECVKTVEDNGWVHDPDTDLYEDIDYSAYHQNGDARPAFKKLMDNLDEYDALVFWKTDRLVRRIIQFAKVMEAAEEAGVRLVSVQEPLDTETPMGKMMATMLAGVAEQESANISARVTSAQEYLRSQGLKAGGPDPFGWTSVEVEGGGHRMVLDPEEAELVREAVDRVLQGESVRAVAHSWNDEGIPSPTGVQWDDSVLRRLLKSPVLAGYLVHKDSIVRDDDGEPLRPHEALVDDTEYSELQEVLNRRTTKRSRAGKTLLSGLVKCAECGSTLAGRTSDDPSAAYSCKGRERHGESYCPGVAVSKARIEEFVTEAVLHYLAPERIAAAREQVRKERESAKGAIGGEIEAVRHSLDELERDRYERGLYEGEQGAVRYASIHRRLSTRLDELISEKNTDTTAARLVRAAGEVDDLREMWPDLDTNERHQIIAAVVESIEVEKGERGGIPEFDHDRLTIHWKG